MTPEESKIVQEAYAILCKEADKANFIGKYLEFPAYGDYGLQLSKKPVAYEHKKTGEVIYISCTEKLSDYSDIINPDDYEKVGYSL